MNFNIYKTLAPSAAGNSGAGTELLTLSMAVIFPLAAALAVFVFLRRASSRRKLLSYFCTLPLYILPCIFVFPDLTALFRSLLGSGFTDTVPDEAGLAMAVAFGFVYLGLTCIICAGRVTKTKGIIAMFAVTLVFSVPVFYLSFRCIELFTDSDTAHTVSSLIPFISGGTVGNLSASILICLPAVLFIPLLFLCFLFNRKQDDLIAEDIEILRMIEAKEQLTEKEGICKFCRYAVEVEGARGRVRCDFKGETDSDGRCHRFEYDPLKRLPEDNKPTE